jgi:hypothetical protein
VDPVSVVIIMHCSEGFGAGVAAECERMHSPLRDAEAARSSASRSSPTTTQIQHISVRTKTGSNTTNISLT